MEQNLNLYRIFYEVAKCRNLSAAAKKLYISQPAVSKSISRLEENLGAVLFCRTSRGVSLTPEGELLCRHVEEALTALQSGEESLRAAQGQDIRRLSIGVSTTLCKYVLLPLLKTFIPQNPNIKITISCRPTFETIAALQNASIDIGLVGIPDTAPNGAPVSPASAVGHTVTYLPLKSIADIFVATDAYLAPFLTARTDGMPEHRSTKEDGKPPSLCWTGTTYPASIRTASFPATASGFPMSLRSTTWTCPWTLPAPGSASPASSAIS